MPSDELTAEIEKAAEEMSVEDTGSEEVVSEKAVQEAADASAQSDEDKAAAEVAEVDDAAATKAAEDEAAATKSAEEEAAAAEAAGQEVVAETVSDELLERAVDVDISVADARSLPLGSLERIVEAREAAVRNELVAEEKKAAGAKEVVDPFADIPKLDPEVHDAEVIKSFEKVMAIAKAQHETTRQQQETIQALQGRQEETSLAADVKAAAEVEQWFDRQIAGLGKEFSEALGTGGYKSLSQGSSQYTKREAIANQLSVMIAGYNATGQQGPPREELFETAAKLVLADEYQKIRDGKLSGDLEAQASQHIQRAGGSKASGAQSPEQETADMIDAKFN